MSIPHRSLLRISPFSFLRVTVIIQGILTTLIAGALVRDDVYAKRIEPFSFPWPHVAWWQHTPSWWKRFIGTGEKRLTVAFIFYKHASQCYRSYHQRDRFHSVMASRIS